MQLPRHAHRPSAASARSQVPCHLPLAQLTPRRRRWQSTVRAQEAATAVPLADKPSTQPGTSEPGTQGREGSHVGPSFAPEQITYPPVSLAGKEKTFTAYTGWTADITSFPGAKLTALRALPTASSHNACSPREWGQAVAPLVEQHLPATGAVLFKGLPIHDRAAFKEFADGLQWTRLDYQPVGRVRKPNLDGIGTDSDGLPSMAHTCHNKMSYHTEPPQRASFFCLQPAQQGGEDLLCSNHDIYKLIPQDIVAKFAAKGGVKYTRAYRDTSNALKANPPHPRPPTWQEYSGTGDKQEAEKYWRDMGFTVSWDAQDSMLLSFTAPAVRKDPATGQDLWFNSAEMARTFLGEMLQITYADGDPIEEDVLNTIRQVRWQAVSAFKLEAGDFLVLDNFRMQHGRMAYEGSGRNILLVMT